MAAALQPQPLPKTSDHRGLVSDQPMTRVAFQGRLNLWDALGLLVIVIAAIAGGYHFGMRGVEQWDMSIFADGAYRIYHGQMPYRDFHLPIGPVTFYVVAAVCRVLGAFTWSTLILSNALIGAAATILAFLTLRLFLRTAPSLLFAAVLATTFALPLSFPWHDVVAMLWATGALALVALALNAARPDGIGPSFMLGIAGGLTALSILTKQNIGGALFLTLVALFVCLPFVEGEPIRARVRRLIIYAGSCLLLVAGLTLFFQSQGPFLSDIRVANNQLSRLAKLWNGYLLIDDLRFWWEPWRLDVKLLALLTAGVPALCYLHRISLPRMRVIALAAAGLAVTYFMRRTGVGAYQMYVLIVPLALGFLYAACAPSNRTISVPSRKLLTLWYPAIVFAAGLAIVALSRRSAMDTGNFFIAGRYSLSWFCLIVIAAMFAAGLIWTLPAIRRTREIILSPGIVNRALAAARWALVLIAVGMGIKSLHVSAAREAWHPSYLTDLVRFQSAPVMAGVQATPAVVGPVEDLVRWFQPRLRENPELARGNELFVYPSFQMLYSVLAVQSFRGVTLWYDWKLSYSREDCDTDVILATRPRFIVRHEVEPTPYGKPQAGMLATAPRLRRHIEEHYQVAYRNEIFTVLEWRGSVPTDGTH